jgi:hypothetical protein
MSFTMTLRPPAWYAKAPLPPLYKNPALSVPSEQRKRLSLHHAPQSPLSYRSYPIPPAKPGGTSDNKFDCI